MRARWFTEFFCKILDKTCFAAGGGRGCGGVVVSALDFGSKGRWSMPSPCYRVVSFDKNLYPALSLSTQVYKWVPVTYC